MHNNLYWMDGSNFGDALNPYLYKKITGRTATQSKPFCPKPHYMAIGSVLNHASPTTVVWGTGLAWERDIVNPKADIRAVRGPITREIAMRNGCSCPEVYGDPALLLPRYYNPKVDKKYKLGIIPHVIDKSHVSVKSGSDIGIINLNDPTEKVVRDVLACETIISSSLHGLIISDAYGIPAKWVEFSDNVLGDNTKFHDYFDSIHIPRYTPLDLKKTREIHLISVPEYDIVIDLDDLMNACPFK